MKDLSFENRQFRLALGVNKCKTPNLRDALASCSKKRNAVLFSLSQIKNILTQYCNQFYYIDASVLLENNQWSIFHILTSEDIDVVIYFLH